MGVPGKIVALEYDPNRSARIALVYYVDGDKRYILAPEGLKVGDQVVAGPRTKVKLGNRMELQNIPVGYKIYNLEMQIGRGGTDGSAPRERRPCSSVSTAITPSSSSQAVRSAKSVKNALPRSAPSVTPEHNLITIGKAGRMRWMGRKPQVLGKSMNAVDHPHGEAKATVPSVSQVRRPRGERRPWASKRDPNGSRRSSSSAADSVRRRKNSLSMNIFSHLQAIIPHPCKRIAASD